MIPRSVVEAIVAQRVGDALSFIASPVINAICE